MKNFFLIAGPCVIEDRDTCFQIAETVNEICKKYGIEYIFKGSYKKANRSRIDSFTGIEKVEALSILKDIKEHFSIPVITDIHESHECEEVAKYVDYLQIPAFLCRQTDLLLECGKTGKGVNIKKGQFLAPESMEYALQKVKSTGNEKIWLTERGTTFGYESLVVDFTGIPKMQALGAEVIVDCTHSVQKPNQTTGITGGDPDQIGTISYAAIASGADGLFLEVHPNPEVAKSDSKSMLKLDMLEPIIEKCVKIKEAIQ